MCGRSRTPSLPTSKASLGLRSVLEANSLAVVPAVPGLGIGCPSVQVSAESI